GGWRGSAAAEQGDGPLHRGVRGVADGSRHGSSAWVREGQSNSLFTAFSTGRRWGRDRGGRSSMLGVAVPPPAPFPSFAGGFMPLSRCLVLVVFALSARLEAQAVPAPAPAAPAARAFPMDVTSDEGARGLQLAAHGEALDGLLPLSRVTLTGVPRPGGAPLDVVLERVPIASADGVVAVDGVPQAGLRLDAGLSLWSGRVVGEP